MGSLARDGRPVRWILLDTFATESNALVDVVDDGGTEAVLLLKLLGEEVIIIVEVEEDSVDMVDVDLYFDDS